MKPGKQYSSTSNDDVEKVRPDPFLAGGREIRAESWKPITRGDALMGKLRSIRMVDSEYGPFQLASFSPAVVRAIVDSGDRATLDAFRDVDVILTAALRAHVREGIVGQCVSLVYDGEESRSGGRTLRRYTVAVVPPTKLGDALRQLDAPRDMLDAIGEVAADNLPF